MAISDDTKLKAIFTGCIGSAILLAAVNWGYYYDHEFDATIQGYEVETTCSASTTDCRTSLTHLIVENHDTERPHMLSLAQPIIVKDDTSLPFQKGQSGTVSVNINPVTRARMHTSRNLELSGASFTPQ